MMIDKNIKIKAKEINRQNKANSWMLGIFTGILLAIFTLLCVFLPAFSIIIIPFLVMPTFYAAIMTHLSFSFDQNVSTGNFFKYFGAYFRRPNNGTFDFMSSFFKALLISILLDLVFGVLGFMIANLVDADGLNAAFMTLRDNLNNIGDFDSISDLLKENTGIFVLFFDITTIPPVAISSLCFAYFAIKHSVSAYLRLSMPKADPRYVKMVFNQTYLKNKKVFNGAFFGLTWPLFLLLLLGMAAGIGFGTFFTLDAETLNYIGLSAGFILMSLYLPFHFGNMEAIYLNFEDDYKKSSTVVAQDLLKQLKARMEISKAQEEQLEKSLEDLKKAQGDEQSEENDKEEDD